MENFVLVMEEALHKGFCPSKLVYSKLSNRLLASNMPVPLKMQENIGVLRVGTFEQAC